MCELLFANYVDDMVFWIDLHKIHHQTSPKGSRYVLRKGIPLHVYSKEGIGTLNPSLGRSLHVFSDDFGVFGMIHSKVSGSEIRPFQSTRWAPRADRHGWSSLQPPFLTAEN